MRRQALAQRMRARTAPEARRRARRGGRTRGRPRCASRVRRAASPPAAQPGLGRRPRTRSRRARSRARGRALPATSSAADLRRRGGRCDPFADEPLEPVEIERVGLDADRVARRRRHDDVVRGALLVTRLEQSSQLHDVDLKRRLRGRRDVLAPQVVDQTVGGHHPVGIEQQDREERPRFRRTQRKRSASTTNLGGTENAERERLVAGHPFGRRYQPESAFPQGPRCLQAPLVDL